MSIACYLLSATRAKLVVMDFTGNIRSETNLVLHAGNHNLRLDNATAWRQNYPVAVLQVGTAVYTSKFF